MIKCALWSWLWETKMEKLLGNSLKWTCVWAWNPYNDAYNKNLFLPANWTEVDFKIPKTPDHRSPLFEHDNDNDDDDSVAYNIQLTCTSVHITLWNLVKIIYISSMSLFMCMCGICLFWLEDTQNARKAVTVIKICVWIIVYLRVYWEGYFENVKGYRLKVTLFKM